MGRAFLASALALAGCGDPDSAPANPATSAVEAQADPADSAQDILLKVAAPELPDWAKDNLSRRDPAVDQWPSEVLHDRAKKVLDAFLKEVCGAEAWDPARLAGVLAPSFRGASVLRPAQLAVVFDDRNARVSRPPALERELRGLDELPELAARMRAAFEGGKCHWFAKIVRVDLEGRDRFHTTAIVHTDGPSRAGFLQQNMEWRCDWVVLPGDEEVRIEAVQLERYDEVWLERTPFAELQGAVFGANRSFREELLHGVEDYQDRTDRLIGNEFLGMQGIALGDVDGDGLEDVYVAQPSALPNRLYLHQPDGTALDATVAAHAGVLEDTRGVLILDLDNDGDQDLLLAAGPALVSARNDGHGVFQDFRLARAETPGDIYSLSAADADSDGDLDVYACRYAEHGILFGVPTPYHDANNGNPNVYFRNDGEEFTIATDEAGFGANNHKFSLASVWEDFDADGDLDLFVANDFGRDNLFRNDGTGHFADVAPDVGADDISAGMGATVADYDLDGDMDLYITNMFSSAGQRIVPQSDKFMGGEHPEIHQHYQRHARGNTLLANRGDGTFEDATDQAGVAVGGWGWGATFVDYNNDGLEDIFAPDGFITNRESEDL